MKYILILIVTFSSIFAQEKNIFELKAEISKDFEIHQNSIKFDAVKSKKSPGLALLFSLALPGMGELYANNYGSGKYFTIAEAGLWGIYFGIDAYSNWQKDNYKAFAILNGGVVTEGKDEEYFADISEFESIYAYNHRKSLDREFASLYDVDKYYWDWGSENNRREYRNMWESSERAYNNLRFAVGAMFVNRVISAINAVRSVKKYNNSLSTEQSWNISVSPNNFYGFSNGYKINFMTSF